MLSDLLNTIRNRRQKAVSTAAEQYQSLVTRLADGDSPKPEDVESILDAAGCSPEDLEADVSRVLQRREWRAMLDGKAGLQKKRDRLETRRQHEREKMREVRQEYELTMAALAAEISDIDAQLRQADTAAVKLHETSGVAGRQQDICSRRIRPLRDERDAKARELRSAEAAYRQSTEYGGGGERVAKPGREDDAASDKALCDRLRGELAELERQMAEAQADVTALQQHALTA